MFLILAIVGMAVVVIYLLLHDWKKKGKAHQTADYYVLFIIGLLWAIIGGPMIISNGWEFNGMFTIGLAFMLIGLTKFKEWRKKQKTILDMEQKIALLAVLIVTTILVFYTLFFP